MAATAETLSDRDNTNHTTGPRTPKGQQASGADAPVLPHEDPDEFNALLRRYQSDFAPQNAHQEFLVAQMAGARWKLDRVERIEAAMFRDLDTPGDPLTKEAMMAQAFIDKDTANGLARLDRYRASLERTYHRCARELRATQKVQNEANSTEVAEKKFAKLLKKMMEAPPPGYEFQPRLVPKQEKTQPTEPGTARPNGS